MRWVYRWCCTSSSTAPQAKSSSSTSKPVSSDQEPRHDDEQSDKESQTVDRKQFARKSVCREKYNKNIDEKLDAFHCIRRFGGACFSDAHAAYPRFMALLSSAFFVVDSGDLDALISARRYLGLTGDPTKKSVRRHCSTNIPPPKELEKLVASVLRAFLSTQDSQGIRLFTSRMLLEWRIQRMHIRRGCLSDPPNGALYQLVGHEHIGSVKSTTTKLCLAVSPGFFPAGRLPSKQVGHGYSCQPCFVSSARISGSHILELEACC